MTVRYIILKSHGMGRKSGHMHTFMHLLHKLVVAQGVLLYQRSLLTTTFTCGTVDIDEHLRANCSVLKHSSQFPAVGFRLPRSVVYELPFKLSFRILVSFESRNDTCPLSPSKLRLITTFPNAARLVLIVFASWSLKQFRLCVNQGELPSKVGLPGLARQTIASQFAQNTVSPYI